ncbi:MAG: LytTR family transcriptional regulator DNA-binding domain-containing protein [Ignavibacteriales bacterium]|nr:LytTR family transcriptional regulator DNA-binding domain-containing protein [Ignavibacteriales bacterium]OGU82070.1 MAG: DNA-binding response regulator [Stygiobacter sp. RIFOXYA12_FULL_38_9]OGV09554.1 MAG: DNA-binding response regulator [Stygiobacter sp. RIFOXYB2_FULL_37_11]OGV13920.1 MAG: DNA-binding response regulator [Stygiobacter sp. RIFOXYC2_FULL_38_25]OGV15419.1 MAG: DNA-binding response regulator [Stygiobacter sp. RIFOXYA2_FULL_38_8]OGV22193.1 MAG: DNA-binding response regulator [St
MKKIKTLIIDDEQLGRDLIKAYLKKHDSFEVLAECSNGFDGIKQINELKPDLIFLDIQMPKLTGFEMLELIETPPVIIFTTAYDQYALKAFEVNATDYLLKPFSEERFNDALDKATKLLSNKTLSDSKFNDLLKTAESRSESLERIVVKNQQKITLIPVEELKYIEAQDDYTMLHTEKGKFLKQKTMKYFEENLNPKDFVRIHRSYIVRLTLLKQIELLEKETYQVILLDGKKLPVSKSGYQKVKEFFD